jgi:hypothetical protein
VFEISRAWDHWPGDGSKRPGTGKKPRPLVWESDGAGPSGLEAGASLGLGAAPPSLWDIWRATDEQGRPKQEPGHSIAGTASGRAGGGYAPGGHGLAVGIVPSLIGLGAPPSPAGGMTPLVAQGRVARPDYVFARNHLKSFEENIPVRDLWNLVGMAASQRHAYFRRRDKVEYSPVGRDTLLAVAYWLWPYETPASGDVLERFYHPKELHKSILRELPSMRVPEPGEHQGAGAQAMARHEQERRAVQGRMARGQMPDIEAGKEEGRREVRRTLRGALSAAANELTGNLPDRVRLTDSKQYDNDPNIQRVTRPLTGLGREALITAASLGTVNPLTRGLVAGTGRVLTTGARTYVAGKTGASIGGGVAKVVRGEDTVLDDIFLLLDAVAGRGMLNSAKTQGLKMFRAEEPFLVLPEKSVIAPKSAGGGHTPGTVSAAQAPTVVRDKVNIRQWMEDTSPKIKEWLVFWKDRGGETRITPIPAGQRTLLGPKYTTQVINRDRPGTVGHLDTEAHEGFHELVAKHLPSVSDAGDLKIKNIPIGAPIKYLEEVGAYTTGHLATGRLHGVPFAPLEAFTSLQKSEVRTVAVCGVLAGGGYIVYRLKRK